MISKTLLKIKAFYDIWNTQGFVLFSLALQAILILVAPFRKRTSNGPLVWLIWPAYLLADWAANFAVGLISRRQYDRSVHSDDNHADILAFWAPFLLLHLGGPDTITAFALEDNALWLRHLVGLFTQVITTSIVFGQSLSRNKLLQPTVLLLLAGTIKYGERTCALYLANLNKFRKSMLKEPDPGPNYAKLMEEYSSKKDAQLPTRIQMIAEPNEESKTDYKIDESDLEDDVKVVLEAHNFFEIFKGLIVDLIFSFHERQKSRDFFLKRTSKDAFRVIAVELNFFYEVLYTKAVVAHSMLGSLFRFLSWCAVVAAFSWFYLLNKNCLNPEKKNCSFSVSDVRITYTLLFGAMLLDTVALFMHIFSDWTVVFLAKSVEESTFGFVHTLRKFLLTLPRKFLYLKRPNWSTGTTNCLEWPSPRQILFRRWSESLHAFNFIDYCLKERPKRTRKLRDFCRLLLICVSKMFNLKTFWHLPLFCVCKVFSQKDFYDESVYVSKKPLTLEQWDFIFDELRKKSLLADDAETAKRIYSAKGDWVLQDSDWNNESHNLMSYVVDVDYDQSLILWHIATELCYNTEGDVTADDNIRKSRDFCKTFSDYMLYLLVMQPTMMSAVAGIGEIRFRDTCAEAKKFFSRMELGPKEEKKRACDKILDVNTDVKPVAVKGDRSKSVLFDACILAKELQELEVKKWKVMSEVWVELLSYAAGHCRADTHAAQLSKGGEVITFVWLLMAHFGIGDRFQINEGHARAKLIVRK